MKFYTINFVCQIYMLYDSRDTKVSKSQDATTSCVNIDRDAKASGLNNIW